MSGCCGLSCESIQVTESYSRTKCYAEFYYDCGEDFDARYYYDRRPDDCTMFSCNDVSCADTIVIIISILCSVFVFCFCIFACVARRRKKKLQA